MLNKIQKENKSLKASIKSLKDVSHGLSQRPVYPSFGQIIPFVDGYKKTTKNLFNLLNSERSEQIFYTPNLY